MSGRRRLSYLVPNLLEDYLKYFDAGSHVLAVLFR